jgi:hypothetical protein
MLGEIQHKLFNSISLRGKSERQVKAKLTEKTEALKPVLESYAKSIELGVAEYVVRATYMIGKAFVDMAEAYKNQTLFGNADQKIASRIRIVSGLEKYYQKAQEKFGWNVQTAYEQNIQNDWVDKSKEEFMRMAFLKGDLFEEVGRIFVSAKCPRGMAKEDCITYKQVLEEKQLEAQDRAVPKYEEAITAAKELGIADSEWLDKIRERLKFLRPDSDALTVQVVARAPKPAAGSSAGGEGAPSGSSESGGKYTSVVDERLERNLRRINNIVSMRIELEDKLAQLRSIERDAQRQIRAEQSKIDEMQEQLSAK